MNERVPKFAPDESNPSQRDFLVPCLINAYNTGASRLSKAISEFVIAGAVEKKMGGKDAFVRLSQFATESKNESLKEYGPQSSAYTYHVYALRNLFYKNRWIPDERS